MKTYFALLLLLFFLNTSAQDFKKHVMFLASDSLHGRAPGTIDELRAANYIATQLRLAKCKVQFQSFFFHDSSQSVPIENLGRDSAMNVVGSLDFKKDSTIIISAHYDHLGYGSNKSLEIVKKGIYPGADDNASGVAMLIELAKMVSVGHQWKYNFVFVACSAHEAGLFGSEYFSKSEFCKGLKVRAVINFDMLGRLDSTAKVIRVSGAGTDSAFYHLFSYESGKPLYFRYDDENIAESDLKPFGLKNIPVLNLTTGIHEDYHRISDTEDKINYQGLRQIYGLIQKVLYSIGVESR